MDLKAQSVNLVGIVGTVIFMYQSIRAFQKLLNSPHGTTLSYQIEDNYVHPSVDFGLQWIDKPYVQEDLIKIFNNTMGEYVQKTIPLIMNNGNENLADPNQTSEENYNKRFSLSWVANTGNVSPIICTNLNSKIVLGSLEHTEVSIMNGTSLAYHYGLIHQPFFVIPTTNLSQIHMKIHSPGEALLSDLKLHGSANEEIIISNLPNVQDQVNFVVYQLQLSM